MNAIIRIENNLDEGDEDLIADALAQLGLKGEIDNPATGNVVRIRTFAQMRAEGSPSTMAASRLRVTIQRGAKGKR